MKRRSKRSKYGNKRTRGFASKKEARRDQELMLLEKAGEIKGLERQVKFELNVNGIKVCSYIADHCYYDCSTDSAVIEDTKGVQTPIFKLKWKLLKALNGTLYDYRIT